MFTNLISLDNSIANARKNLVFPGKFLVFIGLEGRPVAMTLSSAGPEFWRLPSKGIKLFVIWTGRGASPRAFLKSLPVSPESWLMIIQV